MCYVAGGVALNLLLEETRLLRDIFHDAEEAVHSSFAIDRRLLERAGYTVSTLRELRGFVAVAAVTCPARSHSAGFASTPGRSAAPIRAS